MMDSIIRELAANPETVAACGRRAWDAAGSTYNWEAGFGALTDRLEAAVRERRSLVSARSGGGESAV